MALRLTQADYAEGGSGIIKAVSDGWKVECAFHDSLAILSRRRWFWQKPFQSRHHEKKHRPMRDGDGVQTEATITADGELK